MTRGAAPRPRPGPITALGTPTPADDTVVLPAVSSAGDDPGPPPLRTSRSMRARADEMVRLLERAAPRAGARRRLSSLPAAVAVAVAFAAGGVGLAIGLDAHRTGQDLALPAVPALPAEQAPALPGGAPASDGGTNSPGTGASDADAPATPRVTPTRSAAPRAPARAADVAPRPTTPEAPTTTSPTTTRRTPRSTTSTPSTSPRSATDPSSNRSGTTDTAGGRSALR